MQLRWVLPVLAGACTLVPPNPPEPRTRGHITVDVARVSRLPQPDGFAFDVLHEAEHRPNQLWRDFGAGRTWLHLRRPLGLSFAVSELLRDDDLFLPKDVSLYFAQYYKPLEKPRREIAVLAVDGELAGDKFTRVLEIVPDPGLETQGMGAIDDHNLRVLLGHGIDELVGMAGTEETDTHEWVALIDGDGVVARPDRVIAAACRQRSVLKFRDHFVIVRRWRPSGDPEATYFRVSLGHVLLASQMAIEADGFDFTWKWEGLWDGRMDAPPRTIDDPEWNGVSHVTLHYNEYRVPSQFWRQLGYHATVLGAAVGFKVVEMIVEGYLDELSDDC